MHSRHTHLTHALKPHTHTHTHTHTTHTLHMHPPLTTHTPHAHRWMVWNIFYKRSMALKTNPRTMMGKGRGRRRGTRGRRNRTVMRRRTLELNVSSVSQTHETPSSCRVGTSVSVAVAVRLLAWWWWSLTPPPLSPSLFSRLALFSCLPSLLLPLSFSPLLHLSLPLPSNFFSLHICEYCYSLSCPYSW